MAIRQPTQRTFPGSRYAGVRMSEAEFLALPEEKPYLEYVDGVVLQKAMADHEHRRLAGVLTYEFGAYARANGGDFGPEGRVRLVTGNYHVPDTAYWAAGIESGKDSSPTVAVELRSRDETMVSQRAKCLRYRVAGVPVCWLIDPVSRTVEVFEGDVQGERLSADGSLVTEHMPGFALAAADLFAVLDRP